MQFVRSNNDLHWLMVMLAVPLFMLNFGQNCYSQSDSLNLEDEQGRQGYWVISGAMKSEKGYCDTCKIEEGNYVNNRKEGIWLKYHKDTAVVRLKGTYIDNRPNGSYVKYYKNGGIMEEGNFTSGKQTEVNRRYYNSGCLSQERIIDDSTRKVHKVYYQPNCKLDSSSRGPKEFDYIEGDQTNRTIRSQIQYESSESCFSTKKVISNDTISGIINTNYEYNRELGHHLNGGYFSANGINKVFNSNGELIMTGRFKNKALWDGHYYIYDSDGILLSIAIIKKGVYHSDGALK